MAENTKKFDYFEGFIRAAETACTAAEILVTTLQDNLNDIEKKVTEVHEVEHKADDIFREMIQSLNKAFITPIEREDIHQLATCIDDVVDSIDDVIISFYIYNVTNVHPEAVEFAQVILKSCQLLRDAFVEFKNYKKSDKIEGHLVSIYDCEDEGDRLHQKAVRKLFTGNFDAIEIIKWRRVFDTLENCCDTCDYTASIIASVILKNT